MNFSIIVPGGCNAHCPFCFWRQEAKCNNYLMKLGELIKNLPYGLSLSLTGGEPTISPAFADILRIIKTNKARFSKVVLTTNGTCLMECAPFLEGVVDHVNLSRHDADDTVNASIFGVEPITRRKISDTCNALNGYGVDVTISTVMKPNYDMSEAKRMISFVKEVGASALTLRYNHGEVTDLHAMNEAERAFAGYRSVDSSECPVCRSKTQRIYGVLVHWKASIMEPSNGMNDIYEVIFHPNGKLTTDWEGNNEITPYELLHRRSVEQTNSMNTNFDMDDGTSHRAPCGGHSCGHQNDYDPTNATSCGHYGYPPVHDTFCGHNSSHHRGSGC